MRLLYDVVLLLNSRTLRSVLALLSLGFFKIASSQTSDCAGTTVYLTGTSGNFSSPGYPTSLYKNAQLCFWNIKVSRGYRIRLEFVWIDLEDCPGCLCDYVEVWNGLIGKKEGRIGKFCNSSRPEILYSDWTSLTVKFKTDGTFPHKGFLARFTAVTPDSVPRMFTTTKPLECGFQMLKSTNKGELLSPGYPYTYPSSISCLWRIRVKYDYLAELRFGDFFIENCTNCSCDQVSVWGSSHKDPNEFLGTFCGSSKPPILTSTNKHMLVEFKSDNGSRKLENYKFRAYYKGTNLLEPKLVTCFGLGPGSIGPTVGIVFSILVFIGALGIVAFIVKKTQRQSRRRRARRQRQSTSSMRTPCMPALPNYFESVNTCQGLPPYPGPQERTPGASHADEPPPPYYEREQSPPHYTVQDAWSEMSKEDNKGESVINEALETTSVVM